MASAYDKASLVMLPHAVKEDKLYSVKPEDRSGDFTFSRGSDIQATRVNSSGLIEKAKVNLLLQSNNFGTTWGTSNVSVTGGQSGYDGSSDAWLLNVTATGAYSRITQSTGGSSVVTNSIYAKAGTTDFIAVSDVGGGGTSNVWFNLASGTIGTIFGSKVIDANIENVGGGWYRCSVAHQGEAPSYALWFVTDADNTTSGTIGANVYIQNAQQEYGLIAQDYIETTTTAVVEGLTADLPRLDYSGGASCPSLLLEPSRTNIISQSEYFGSWSLSRTSAFGSGSALNDTTSPEGVVNAAYIQQASGETDGGGVFNGYSYTSGITYTLSVFAKQGENRYARIGFGIGGGGAGIFCGFDLQEGVAGTPNTGITPSIEPFADGWYRCSITATAQTTGVRNTFVYQSSNLNDFVTTPLQGIYIYGAQLEAATYPTSYIPTYGAAANRGADVASKSSATALIGQTEGTLFVEMNRVNKSVDWNFVSCLYNGATGDFLEFLWTSANTLVGHWIASGVYNSITASGYSGNVKMALAYKSGSYAMYVNGVQIGTNTASDVPSCDLVDIGWTTRLSGYQVSDGIKQALLFKTRLTNAELAALTTI